MANEKIICFHLPRPCMWSSVTTPNNASNFVQVFQTSVRIERGVTAGCEAKMSKFLLQFSFIFFNHISYQTYTELTVPHVATDAARNMC